MRSDAPLIDTLTESPIQDLLATVCNSAGGTGRRKKKLAVAVMNRSSGAWLASKTEDDGLGPPEMPENNATIEARRPVRVVQRKEDRPQGLVRRFPE